MLIGVWNRGSSVLQMWKEGVGFIKFYQSLVTPMLMGSSTTDDPYIGSVPLQEN